MTRAAGIHESVLYHMGQNVVFFGIVDGASLRSCSTSLRKYGLETGLSAEVGPVRAFESVAPRSRYRIGRQCVAKIEEGSTIISKVQF
jgi:hypothetical protein